MSRPLKIALIVILVVFPPALLLPALPIFGLVYLWNIQNLPPAESAMVATVYTIPLYIIATVLFVAWFSRRKERGPRPGAHSPAAPLQYESVAEVEERKRKKRRRKAEEAGDVLLTLAFIDADKKRK
jgi:hypothetical protein